MANKILKYIDGIPLYINEEEEAELFKHLNIDALGKTTLPTTSTPFPTIPKVLKYDSPLGNKSVFAEDNSYWLADKLKEEQAKQLLIPSIGELANDFTLNLFNNLIEKANSNQPLFGHQDSLAYGRKWKYEKGKILGKQEGNLTLGRSDIFDVCNDYPAIIGWDLGNYYKETHTYKFQQKNPQKNNYLFTDVTVVGANNKDPLKQKDAKDYLISGVIVEDLKKMIKWTFDKGGVNTISWHCPNPKTGKEFVAYNDPTIGDYIFETVSDIIYDKKSQAAINFNLWLNWVADFIKDLSPIPIIFRPLHEMNLNNVFWWDNGVLKDYSLFRKLWIKVFNHFKDKRIDNVLFAFSISDPLSELSINRNDLNDDIKNEATKKIIKNTYNSEFYKIVGINSNGSLMNDCILDYIDIIGVDIYQRKTNINIESRKAFNLKLNAYCNAQNIIGKYASKVPTITEFGVDNLPYDDWFNKLYLPNEKGETIIENIAYALVWRNPYEVKEKFAEYYCTSNEESAISKSNFRRFKSQLSRLFISFFSSKSLYKNNFIIAFLIFSNSLFGQKNITLDDNYYLKNDTICISQLKKKLAKGFELIPLHNQIATIETVYDFQARNDMTTYVRNSKKKIIMIIKQRWGMVTKEMRNDSTIKNYNYSLDGNKKIYDSSKVEVTEIIFPENPTYIAQLNYWFKDKKELCLFIAPLMTTYNGNDPNEKHYYTFIGFGRTSQNGFNIPRDLALKNPVRFTTISYDTFN